MPEHTFRPTLLPLIVITIILGTQKCVAHSPLTDFMKSKSIVNHGDLAMFSGIFEKLSNKVCLNIIAIGGSVTCGHFNHTMIPNGTRWTEQLQQLLNTQFPCGDLTVGFGQHRVVNMGKGSTTPAMWIEMLVGQQENTFAGADLVILETAVNQEAERSQAQIDAETLMSLVMKRTRRSNSSSTPMASGGGSRGFTGTAAMWVVASTRRYSPVWTGVPYERISDAMHAQVPVAQHHGVPLVSVVDALGPFSTTALQAWWNATWYQGDPIHPSAWGHTLIAELVQHYIGMAYAHSRTMQLYELPKTYVPRDPIFVDNESLAFFLDAKPISLSFSHMGPVKAHRVGACASWFVYSDVPEKRGFISTTQGSSCVLGLTPNDVARLSVGRLHVNMLKSYNGMGILTVTVTTGRTTNSSSCADSYNPSSPILGSWSIDTLWDIRASLGKVEALKFQLPPNDGSTCLLVHLKVEPTTRPANKVKLLGLQFF